MRRGWTFAAAVVAVLGLLGTGPALLAQGPAKPAADPISGTWEGTVDLPDGAVAFTMALKLDGAKVTGEVGSVQGTVPISAGSWADGKLMIGFTYVDGAAIEMAGVMKDGAFSGTLSYGGGQMVVTWAAKKKVDK